MARSISLGILSSLLLVCATRAQPEMALRPAQRYELSATLDPEQRRVDGTLRLEFRNSSTRPLEKLLFHLYMNAFASRTSVFMRESRGSMRGQLFEGTGSIELKTLTVDGRDALRTAESELVPGDRTQLTVPLERALERGASVTIESRFVVRLPPVFARAGYAGSDFFAVAQWFPKLAKLEANGHFEGFPYHALGEFYADFADYVVTVRTPSAMQVAATGLLAERREQGAHTLRRFEAYDVHDFAFMATVGYEEARERVNGTLVHMLYPPGCQDAAVRHGEVLRAGLRSYGNAFGAYPYPALSLVLPPRHAAGAAGMEYPTLLLTAGDWIVPASLPSLSGAFVTAHELAHQWFQGMLASNEVRHPVLDEGLAQWAALDLMRTMYGAREGLLGVAIDRFEVVRLLATAPTPSTAQGRPAHEYAAGEYASSVYARAALALESIRRAHGREPFDRALALYTQRERFGHPTPAALEQAFDDVYGAGFAVRVLRPLLFGGESSAVHLAATRRSLREQTYVTEVRARRTGAVSLPTSVAVMDADGRELERALWPSGSDSLLVALETKAPVARVVLDPDRALLLDDNVRDQVATFRSESAKPLLARTVALVQALVTWIGP